MTTTEEPRGFKPYAMFQSLRLHFNKNLDYNAIAYKFKTRVSSDKFLKSKQRYAWAKLEKDNSPNETLWLLLQIFKSYNFKLNFTENAIFYRLHKNKTQFNITYFFETTLQNDLQYLKTKYNTLDELINSSSGLYPSLYNEYLLQQIDLFTLLTIDLFMTPSSRCIINKERSKDVLNWTSFIDESELIKPLLFSALDDNRFYSVFDQFYER